MLYAVNTLIEGTFSGVAVLPLTFIGGFIFHLFWEGKCQYTLPYFMLLLPLSIIGFYSMAKKLSSVTIYRYSHISILGSLNKTGKYTALVSAVAALAYSDEMFILL